MGTLEKATIYSLNLSSFICGNICKVNQIHWTENEFWNWENGFWVAGWIHWFWILSLPYCSKCCIFLAANLVLTLFILMLTTSCWFKLRSSLNVSRDFSVIGLKLMSITYNCLLTLSSLNNSIAPSSVMPHYCSLSS